MPDFRFRSFNFAGVLALIAMLAGCAELSPAVTQVEVDAFAAPLARELANVPAPPAGVLTAADAVDRAIHHNQALRAKELEVALAQARVHVQAGGMLPSIVAESSYFRRDRPLMSRSSASASYSTSTDPLAVSREIAASWNILDFGLAYVRSVQSLDKARYQHEEARRVAMRIVEETRATYWRAVALQKLHPEIARLDREVAAMLAMTARAAADPQIDPMTAINFQRDILNLQRDINQLDISLAGSVDQLRQSTGLSAMSRLRLEPPRWRAPLARATESAAEDVEIALRQRPEIRQHMYEMRITSAEVHAAIMQILPGISLSRSLAEDSNSYLLNAHWISWGTRVAGNLIGLLRLPSELEAVESQQAVNRQNALATAAAVVMQVHVARARLAVQNRAYRDALRFARAQRQLLDQVCVSVQLGKVGQQALLREKLSTLLAEVRAIVAYADVAAAFAAYQTARGDDTWREPSRAIAASAAAPAIVRAKHSTAGL